MIHKLAEEGMNVARLNMSHGDHASHKKVIDLVKEYNAQSADNVIAIMLDTKVIFRFETDMVELVGKHLFVAFGIDKCQ